jgi:hypothetical protein
LWDERFFKKNQYSVTKMVFDRFTSQFLVKPVCLVVTPARTMTSWEWVAEIMALHLQKKTTCAPIFTFVQGKFNFGTLARASALTQATSEVYRVQHRSKETV